MFCYDGAQNFYAYNEDDGVYHVIFYETYAQWLVGAKNQLNESILDSKKPCNITFIHAFNRFRCRFYFYSLSGLFSC